LRTTAGQLHPQAEKEMKKISETALGETQRCHGWGNSKILIQMLKSIWSKA
jgi:hypothetical protein